MNKLRTRRALAGAVLMLGLLSACSPEGARTRGGGLGGDIGNRDNGYEERTIELHKGAQPDYHVERQEPGPAGDE